MFKRGAYVRFCRNSKHFYNTHDYELQGIVIGLDNIYPGFINVLSCEGKRESVYYTCVDELMPPADVFQTEEE